jgi:aromatic ring hydroxylase
MSSFALVVYYMTKEAVTPRMHHSNFKEYLDDVDIDCFHCTHSFEHVKYIRDLRKLIEDY